MSGDLLLYSHPPVKKTNELARLYELANLSSLLDSVTDSGVSWQI